MCVWERVKQIHECLIMQLVLDVPYPLSLNIKHHLANTQTTWVTLLSSSSLYYTMNSYMTDNFICWHFMLQSWFWIKLPFSPLFVILRSHNFFNMHSLFPIFLMPFMYIIVVLSQNSMFNLTWKPIIKILNSNILKQW